ncbi:MAG: RdgB/HAM1 family non-canonical purine NTP pyrophosphatase [Opitutales bacterium]
MQRRTLVLATGNAHKVEELTDWIARASLPVEAASAEPFGGMPPVEETGTTFEANARLKAEGLRDALLERGQPLPFLILADDSGLEVEALGGAPGVYSARFAGPDADDARNNAKLLAALTEVAAPERGARFVCQLFGLQADGNTLSLRGVVEGRVADAPRGSAGFGYDPLFIPEGYEQSFGELGAEVKRTLSHRARALEAFAMKLPTLLE